MKKTITIMIFIFSSFLTLWAQKEAGTVYSEHEAIQKAKAMWNAYASGSKESFFQFFADSIRLIVNGESNTRSVKDLAQSFKFRQEFENFSFKDENPAVPSAIQYKKSGLWVQDWLRLTGIHKETGIKMEMAVNDLYRFNKEGKIDTWIQYLNPAMLEEIANSRRTIENGKVYINHPYIVTVRKCVNAYCAEDLNSLRTFYSPKAVFRKSDFKAGKVISLEEKMKENKEVFANWDNITFQQFGYPDCIYYTKEDNYTVYSWWILSYMTKEGKKKKDIPVMWSSMFDKDGKIEGEFVYLSSNHFE